MGAVTNPFERVPAYGLPAIFLGPIVAITGQDYDRSIVWCPGLMGFKCWMEFESIGELTGDKGCTHQVQGQEG